MTIGINPLIVVRMPHLVGGKLSLLICIYKTHEWNIIYWILDMVHHLYKTNMPPGNLTYRCWETLHLRRRNCDFFFTLPWKSKTIKRIVLWNCALTKTIQNIVFGLPGYIWCRVPCCQSPPPNGMGPKPTFWLHFHGTRRNTWYLQCFDKLGLRTRGICSVL